MKNRRPMSELEKQYAPLPGELDIKDAFTKAATTAAQVMPRRIKEFKKQEKDSNTKP
jgi:hypothetical protein